jgi:hypothetical protein
MSTRIAPGNAGSQPSPAASPGQPAAATNPFRAKPDAKPVELEQLIKSLGPTTSLPLRRSEDSRG